MKRNATNLIFGLSILLAMAAIGYWINGSALKKTARENLQQKLRQSSEENEIGSELEESKERNAYFFRLLRNPALNIIPSHIRSSELNHSKKIPSRLQLFRGRNRGQAPGGGNNGFIWQLAGPPAVGGRTRALGIDQRNSNIIIAGGVSGGIWKSTDGGDSWDLRTSDAQNFSVTSLAQDPTNPDTWYYTAGELLGNSASGRNNSAPYYGRGIFKSTDNGDSWSILPSTKSNLKGFVGIFNTISRVVVNPTTESVFIASNGFGIYRSTNGSTFESDPVLGPGNINSPDQPLFLDIAAASNGTLAAVISEASFGDQVSANSGDAPQNTPGIFISTNDGDSWTEITPDSFSSTYRRSVLAFAPSDPNILYVFTLKGTNNTSNQELSFYKLNLNATPQDAQDRAANLPDFGPPVGGLNTQGGYDMVVRVKPDNPDFVLVGGTDLFRSTDGFSSGPTGNSQAQKDKFWVGGYAKANDISNYPNQHADQHIIAFEPNSPNNMWVGHDGGLSLTNDVSANAVSWQEKNDGYIVTQFYDASIGAAENDNRFAGGSQDNGTPFFTFSGQQAIGNASSDISSGDGGFSFFTKNFVYSSNARNRTGVSRVIRFNKALSNFSFVQPAQATAVLFINPYTVDPNDEGIMYYPGGSDLFRNTQVDEIDNQNGGATQGWERLDAASLSGFNISALDVSTIPANILYYAGSSGNNRPVIKRLTNANQSNNAPDDISIPKSTVPEGSISGAFVHDIAVNPANGNDIMAVMANYDIVGLYHSADGGNNWQAVEGNLTGVNDPASPDQGPSIRSATIIPAQSGTIYILATSTGIYSTRNLDGQNTQWVRESAADNDGDPDIGFSVVENITSRFSDGDIAVGTHGRGLFVGRFQGQIIEVENRPRITPDPQKGRGGNPTIDKNGTKITITAQNFQFTKNDSVFFDGVPADITTTNFPANKVTVFVPRVPIPQNAQLNQGNFPATITVKTNGRTITANFTLQFSQKNNLSQNYPNPFQNTTSVPIEVAQKSRVRLSVYNTSGQQVYQSQKKVYSAGTHDIPLDFSGKASGIYIYRVIIEPTGSGDTFKDSKKFTFIK